MFLHGKWTGLDLFSAVALFWRSCSSFNQFKAVLVASASNGGVLFFRNPGSGFCSGADIKKLGFRLDFLLTVAVKSVSDLITTLDPSQRPLKVLLSVWPLETEGLHPAKWEDGWENQGGCFSQLLLTSAQSWCYICQQETAPGRILSGELRTFQGREAEKAVCQHLSTDPSLIKSSCCCCSDVLGVSGLWDFSETFNAFWDTLQKCHFLSPSAL